MENGIEFVETITPGVTVMDSSGLQSSFSVQRNSSIILPKFITTIDEKGAGTLPILSFSKMEKDMKTKDNRLTLRALIVLESSMMTYLAKVQSEINNYQAENDHCKNLLRSYRGW